MELFYCWIHTNVTLDMLRNILVSMPGVVLAGFSFYFAYQKIGDKVLTTYSVVYGTVSAKRISEITLINKKNKPLIIFSIQAVINKEIVIEVESFETGLILKPLESIHIKTTPFSNFRIGSDAYDVSYFGPDLVEIYLLSDSRKNECKTISSPILSSFFDPRIYSIAGKTTHKFNGYVFNETVRYAITYKYMDETKTAFVHYSGAMLEGWDFKYNFIEEEFMVSADSVKKHLVDLGFDKHFEFLVVDDLKKRLDINDEV